VDFWLPTLFDVLMSNVIVWDIETVPDLKGFAAANGHVGKSDDEVRAVLGDKFPKHIYHSIICIGALVAHSEEGGQWIVMRLEHRTSESYPSADYILRGQDAASRRHHLQRVVFRPSRSALPGHGPQVAAPTLCARISTVRGRATDLCDVLSSFSSC
jgi:hypothetical protein